jgi:hypothetical protein
MNGFSLIIVGVNKVLTFPLYVTVVRRQLSILRDYSNATHVWFKLMPSNHISNLFSLTCKDWIFKSIINHSMKFTRWFGFQISWWRAGTCEHCETNQFFEEDFQRSHDDPTFITLKVPKVIEWCSQAPISNRQSDTIYID